MLLFNAFLSLGIKSYKLLKIIPFYSTLQTYMDQIFKNVYNFTHSKGNHSTHHMSWESGRECPKHSISQNTNAHFLHQRNNFLLKGIHPYLFPYFNSKKPVAKLVFYISRCSDRGTTSLFKWTSDMFDSSAICWDDRFLGSQEECDFDMSKGKYCFKCAN